MAEVLLHDSAICRLCGENNTHGEYLYSSDTGEPDLSLMVNRYLPLKIRDDGKLPRTICPGCKIQLDATGQFFDLLVEGQAKIRELWRQQVEHQKKVERERLRIKRESAEFTIEALEDYEPNEDDAYSPQIIVRIMADGSMYTAEHDMSLQMEGLEKPRRKRGRPPKIHAEDEIRGDEEVQEILSQEEDDKQDEEDEIDGDGRRRRKRKIPKRFSEAVQGKDLERLFKEEGVIDDEEGEVIEGEYDDSEEQSLLPMPDTNEEVIGHLETEEGKDLGELIIVNRGRGRRSKVRRKKTKFTCNLCGRGFLQRSRYMMHQDFHKSVKYECVECNRQFTKIENFKLHQKTQGHTGENIINNQEDSKNSIQDDLTKIEGGNSSEKVLDNEISEELPLEPSENVESLGAEIDTSIDVKLSTSHLQLFNCDQCDDKFPSANALEVHVKELHDTGKPFSCNICNKTFAYGSSLKGHMLTHDTTKGDKAFACDICGKVLNHPSSVVYHKEAEHNDGRRFVCNKCSKSFKHKQLLQRHQLVHSEDRPYVCKNTKCNASFKTKANLINHQSTHTGEKKYSCDQCGQQFAHKTSLTLHNRWHNGDKPYTCEFCNKSFSQNGNLQEHKRIHTKEKPYICEECGRKFTTSSQYKLHVKRHTGERPWKCEYCTKTFLHKDTWKCHVRRHNGERPFQCKDCNRGFTEQWALKKHQRIHTGEKPYKCTICDKAFADCSNLTKHKKQVHKSLHDPLKASSSAEELWQILPTENEENENSLDDQIHQMIATDGTPEDGTQIIYVSYPDPDDPNQHRTIHFGYVDDKEGTESGQSLPSLDVDENEMIVKAVSNETEHSGDMEVDLSDQSVQFQFSDRDGNQIPLSFHEARQFLTGDLVELSDGQTIRVHSDIDAQQLAEQLGVHVHQDIDIDSMHNIDHETSIIDNPASDDDANTMAKLLADETSPVHSTSAGNEISDDANTEMVHDQTFELTNADGRKLRFLPLQLPSEYLTII